MDRPTCASLVRTHEADPSRVPGFYRDLEAAVRWFMDTTYETTDQDFVQFTECMS